MVNMTVVKGKDILKHGIKIGIFLIFLFLLQKIFISSKKEEIKLPKLIDETKLIACLEESMPIMKEVNNVDKEDLEEKVEKINPLKLVVDTQLEGMNNIKPKENKEEKNKEGNVQTETKVEQAQTGLTTQVIESNVPTKFTNSYNGVEVKNETEYNLTEEMLKPDITINNENILIFHTHTCESYTPTENFQYQQTGTYRTTDLNYNVARVGTELTAQLNSYGYNVIHDTTYHDYPAYSGSYGRSLTTVENLLKQNTNTDVVIDLHRDAIGDYSYAPTVQIGDESAARLMFVIGTDGGGLEHPNWNQNLKFAVKIQEKANELYPGLFKPIILRNSRYNQHLSKAACIIEVGATGNTMEQCLTSMKYLAKVISEVMK